MEESEFILSSFSQILKTPCGEASLIGEYVPIPSFSEECILAIINCAQEKFKAQSAIFNLDNEVVVVGDIHGNLHDLIRILNSRGIPPKTNYIFLGDYVDRGDFQLECIALLYSLYNLYPNCITLLRGNHEFKEINEKYGFKAAIQSQYNSIKIWESFNESFEYLPLIAILQKKYFCCHGGIPSQITDISKIFTLNLPIDNFSNPIVEDLMWGDPTNEVSLSGAETSRGRGHQFGRGTLSYFLSTLGLSSVIRAHQCVDGVESKWGSTCITVFSSSGYSLGFDNHTGHIFSDKQGILHKYAFSKISKIPRKDCTFYQAIMSQQNEDSGSKKLKWSGLLLAKATTSNVHQSSFVQKKIIRQPLPKRRTVSSQRTLL